MKLNLEEQEETIEPVEKTDLIYGIDDRPDWQEDCPLYSGRVLRQPRSRW